MKRDFENFQKELEKDLNSIQTGLDRALPGPDWSLFTFSGHIVALSNLFKGVTENAVADLELTHSEENVIGILRSEAADTPGKLARLIYQSPAGMTRTLDRLETRGLVERAVDPDNLRQVKISLTQSGRELGERMLRLQAQVLEDAFGNLDARSRAVIQDSIDKLIDRLAGVRAKSKRHPA